jgi:Ca2+-transporting ATPase
LILVNRSWTRTILGALRTPNAALWWVLGGAALFLGLALSIPFPRSLFRFNVPHPIDLAICLAAGILSILWFEAMKLINRHRRRRITA